MDLSEHLKWAEAHERSEPAAKQFMEIARLYQGHPDHVAYGLLQLAAKNVEKRWREYQK